MMIWQVRIIGKRDARDHRSINVLLKKTAEWCNHITSRVVERADAPPGIIAETQVGLYEKQIDI